MTGPSSSCGYCHPGGGYWPESVTGTCQDCHGDEWVDGQVGYEEQHWFGPHGGYLTTTSKCDNCHAVHNANPAGTKLLRTATVYDTCFTCHDGTQGYGVYGTIEKRTGVPATGGHRFNTAAWVPGGSGTTGGGEARDFSGAGNSLVCSDCHAVHGADTVAPFVGDRRRVRNAHPNITSDRLLRRSPVSSTSAPVDDYGSDWCITCHAGRADVAPLHNHPVDSIESSTAPTWEPFTYSRVPILASDDPTGATVVTWMGGLPASGAAYIHSWPWPMTDGAGNRGYLMPYPRTNEQRGHAPICQQCHEDTRSVGTLVGDGTTADAAPAVVTAADAVVWSSPAFQYAPTDNPRFQNFPHETENDYMLVETYDDLCLNCHPASGLP